MKLGLIGVGYWGKNLARNFNDLGVLNAICDDNKENLSAVGQNYAAIQQYAGISDMLNDSAIDRVAISTPAATHGELTRRSLKRTSMCLSKSRFVSTYPKQMKSNSWRKRVTEY